MAPSISLEPCPPGDQARSVGVPVGSMVAKGCISLWRRTHLGMPAAAAVPVALPLAWRLRPDLQAAARPPLLTEFSRSGSFDDGDVGIALVVSFLRLVPARSPSYSGRSL